MLVRFWVLTAKEEPLDDEGNSIRGGVKCELGSYSFTSFDLPDLSANLRMKYELSSFPWSDKDALEEGKQFRHPTLFELAINTAYRFLKRYSIGLDYSTYKVFLDSGDAAREKNSSTDFRIYGSVAF